MYQTSKKKKRKKKDSRFNNLYILKLNQVDDKHQEWEGISKVRQALVSGHLGWRHLGLSHGTQGFLSQVLLQVIQAVIYFTVRFLYKQKAMCISQRLAQRQSVVRQLNNIPCWAESFESTNQRNGFNLSWLSILLHALGFLYISSRSATTTFLLLMLLVLFVFLLFLVFLFLLLFLLLSTAVNIRILWGNRFLWGQDSIKTQTTLREWCSKHY